MNKQKVGLFATADFKCRLYGSRYWTYLKGNEWHYLEFEPEDIVEFASDEYVENIQVRGAVKDIHVDISELTSISNSFRDMNTIESASVVSSNEITEAVDTFKNSSIKEFDVPMMSLVIADGMFDGTTNLDELKIDASELESLESANRMFANSSVQVIASLSGFSKEKISELLLGSDPVKIDELDLTRADENSLRTLAIDTGNVVSDFNIFISRDRVVFAKSYTKVNDVDDSMNIEYDISTKEDILYHDKNDIKDSLDTDIDDNMNIEYDISTDEILYSHEQDTVSDDLDNSVDDSMNIEYDISTDSNAYSHEEVVTIDDELDTVLDESLELEYDFATLDGERIEHEESAVDDNLKTEYDDNFDVEYDVSSSGFNSDTHEPISVDDGMSSDYDSSFNTEYDLSVSGFGSYSHEDISVDDGMDTDADETMTLEYDVVSKNSLFKHDENDAETGLSEEYDDDKYVEYDVDSVNTDIPVYIRKDHTVSVGLDETYDSNYNFEMDICPLKEVVDPFGDGSCVYATSASNRLELIRQRVMSDEDLEDIRWSKKFESLHRFPIYSSEGGEESDDEARSASHNNIYGRFMVRTPPAYTEFLYVYSIETLNSNDESVIMFGVGIIKQDDGRIQFFVNTRYDPDEEDVTSVYAGDLSDDIYFNAVTDFSFALVHSNDDNNSEYDIYINGEVIAQNIVILKSDDNIPSTSKYYLSAENGSTKNNLGLMGVQAFNRRIDSDEIKFLDTITQRGETSAIRRNGPVTLYFDFDVEYSYSDDENGDKIWNELDSRTEEIVDGSLIRENGIVNIRTDYEYVFWVRTDKLNVKREIFEHMNIKQGMQMVYASSKFYLASMYHARMANIPNVTSISSIAQEAWLSSLHVDVTENTKYLTRLCRDARIAEMSTIDMSKRQEKMYIYEAFLRANIYMSGNILFPRKTGEYMEPIDDRHYYYDMFSYSSFTLFPYIEMVARGLKDLDRSPFMSMNTKYMLYSIIKIVEDANDEDYINSPISGGETSGLVGVTSENLMFSGLDINEFFYSTETSRRITALRDLPKATSLYSRYVDRSYQKETDVFSLFSNVNDELTEKLKPLTRSATYDILEDPDWAPTFKVLDTLIQSRHLRLSTRFGVIGNRIAYMEDDSTIRVAMEPSLHDDNLCFAMDKIELDSQWHWFSIDGSLAVQNDDDSLTLYDADSGNERTIDNFKIDNAVMMRDESERWASGSIICGIERDEIDPDGGSGQQLSSTVKITGTSRTTTKYITVENNSDEVAEVAIGTQIGAPVYVLKKQYEDDNGTMKHVSSTICRYNTGATDDFDVYELPVVATHIYPVAGESNEFVCVDNRSDDELGDEPRRFARCFCV